MSISPKPDQNQDKIQVLWEDDEWGAYYWSVLNFYALWHEPDGGTVMLSSKDNRYICTKCGAAIPEKIQYLIESELIEKDISVNSTLAKPL